MKLYKLIHIHDIDDFITPDIKRLGYYTSLEKVEESIAFFVSLSGFCDYPNGFVVTEHEVSYGPHTPKNAVYELCLSVHDKKWDYEYENTISIHSSRKAADDAKRLFKQLNQKDHAIMNCKLIKQIWIDPFYLDEKSEFWSEGFD